MWSAIIGGGCGRQKPKQERKWTGKPKKNSTQVERWCLEAKRKDGYIFNVLPMSFIQGLERVFDKGRRGDVRLLMAECGEFFCVVVSVLLGLGLNPTVNVVFHANSPQVSVPDCEIVGQQASPESVTEQSRWRVHSAKQRQPAWR